MEAQRVISVSLGKIAQSRVTRSGCSLHKSLMVASILQKARHLYVEQTFMMHCRPSEEEEEPVVASSSPSPVDDDAPTYTDLDACSPAQRGLVAAEALPAPCESAVAAPPAGDHGDYRRKRLISDEETEEAVASILPKRQRLDDVPEDSSEEEAIDITRQELAPDSVHGSDDPHSSSKDADSDDSDDSCYESGDSDVSEEDAMEIDRITSLVSVFSFEKLRPVAVSSSDTSPVFEHREWERTAEAVAVQA